MLSDCRSKRILNYCVIVERYSFSDGVVGGLNFAMKSSLYLTEKEN